MAQPNWKNEEDYVFVTLKTIGKSGVAWEFLRRNKQYLHDFEALKSGTVTDDIGNHPADVSNSRFAFNEVKHGFHVPPLEAGESENQWIGRCSSLGVRPRILSPKLLVAKKWGLDGVVPDPNKSVLELDTRPGFAIGGNPRIIQKWDEIDDLIVYEPNANESEDTPLLLDESNTLVVFNLNASISPQWKKIKAQLIDLHKQWAKSIKLNGPGSPKSTAWIPALRAWDASIQKPKLGPTKIAMELYGSDSWESVRTLDDRIETAKRLIDGKYRDIVRRFQ